ncbi:hypothetical protein QR680_011927 [Steinernema hermaphroditum]|uniref:Uncharacterized protein n=1 Tax=Steinernema hermaphroditum TaxID=289476 RepID=A0AA39LZT7_9BILA|nr:hypothetical protein QR680_011927 [Steinernema hermaphroditum]
MSDLDSSFDSSIEEASPPHHQKPRVSISSDEDEEESVTDEEIEEDSPAVALKKFIVRGEFAEHVTKNVRQFKMEFSLLMDATRSNKQVIRYFHKGRRPTKPPRPLSDVVVARIDELFGKKSTKRSTIEPDVEDIVFVGGYNMLMFAEMFPRLGRYFECQTLEDLMDLFLQYKPKKENFNMILEAPENCNDNNVYILRHAEILSWLLRFFASTYRNVILIVITPLREVTLEWEFDDTVNYVLTLKRELKSFPNVILLHSPLYLKKMSKLVEEDGRFKDSASAKQAFTMLKHEVMPKK